MIPIDEFAGNRVKVSIELRLGREALMAHNSNRQRLIALSVKRNGRCVVITQSLRELR